MTKEELMRKAIELSVQNVAEGGGPFGAVIARNGEIIAMGVNRVTPDCDPTAHAEVNPEKNDMVQIHDALEAAEVDIARHMPVRLLLHCDPFFRKNSLMNSRIARPFPSRKGWM